MSSNGLSEIGRGFEALLVNQMLQGMRKTVPNWKNSYFGNSFAEGTFRELLDTEVSKMIADRHDLGIARSIEEKYSEYVEGTNEGNRP